MKHIVRFIILLGLMVFTISLFSCEPEAELIRYFTIQRGEHYASPRIVETQQSNTLRFEARFDQSAVYRFDDESMQSNKNKLLGFADCNSLHHENSARFAWQWFNNQLEIYAYCYVNGSREEKYMGVVSLNEFNLFEIKLTNDSYIFKLNDENPISISRGNTCDKGVYYKLWPYFGGSLPAPHDIRVAIKNLY
jgi:hypothetical protein